MLFEAALLGLIVGLAAGGSLKKLLDMPLKALWLLLGSVLLGLLPRVGLLAAALAQLGTPGAVCFAVIRYGLLLAFVVINRRNIPVLIVGTGGALNMLVTLANGGRMPVLAQAVAGAPDSTSNLLLSQGKILIYAIAGPHTRLALLCDRISVPFFDLTAHKAVYVLSVGDLFIAAGIFALIVLLMRPRRFAALKNRARKHLRAQ